MTAPDVQSQDSSEWAWDTAKVGNPDPRGPEDCPVEWRGHGLGGMTYMERVHPRGALRLCSRRAGHRGQHVEVVDGIVTAVLPEDAPTGLEPEPLYLDEL